MKKPIKLEKIKVVTKAEVKVKKRRKRKDRFSGLNADAVLSATPNKKPLRTSLIEIKSKQLERSKLKEKGRLNSILKSNQEPKRNSLNDFFKSV